MSGRRDGLLADIEAGTLDGTPLSTLLQKCIILGGHAGSEMLRDWARAELHGYVGLEVPDYRKTGAVVYARITNLAGFNGFPQQIHTTDLPKQVRDFLAEQKIRWEEVPFDTSVGDLEATVTRKGDDPVRLSPTWAGHMVQLLNHANSAPNSRVDTLYWELPLSSIEGVLVRIRTALAELVAELVSMTPEGHEVPDKGVADAAISLVIKGGRNTVTVGAQHAGDGGANTITVGARTDEPKTESWFARWRKRGIAVGVATILSLGVAVATWLDWTPW